MGFKNGTGFIGALVAVLTGCSSMQVHKDQVQAVHKVAIVGFAVDQQMPNTGKSVLNSLMAPRDSGPMANMKPAPIARAADHATVMYDSLGKTLKDGMAWQVMPRAQLTRNEEYLKLYADRTKQPQLRPLVNGPNVEVFTPEGVVEDYLLTTMTLPERQALMKKLGVDGIATATVNVALQNGGGLKHLVGVGDFHTQATLAFKVYDATHADPIWLDVYASGEPTEESVEHELGFADVDGLNQQAVLATRSAYQKLLARYKAE